MLFIIFAYLFCLFTRFNCYCGCFTWCLFFRLSTNYVNRNENHIYPTWQHKYYDTDYARAFGNFLQFEYKLGTIRWQKTSSRMNHIEFFSFHIQTNGIETQLDDKWRFQKRRSGFLFCSVEICLIWLIVQICLPDRSSVCNHYQRNPWDTCLVIVQHHQKQFNFTNSQMRY